MKSKLPAWLKLILKLGISAAALYLVYRKIDVEKVGSLFTQLRWGWLLPATLLFIASKIVSSYRLNVFFSVAGLKLSQKYNLRLYWLGMFYNLFLPGGIGGDGYKIWLLNKKYDVPVKKIFLAVLLDRITGVFALICLAAALLPFTGVPWLVKVLGLIAMHVGLLGFYLAMKWFFKTWLPVFTLTNLQSLTVQLLQVLSAWCLLLSLDYTGDLPATLFVFLLSSIVAVIPFTVGGAGARELTFVVGAGWLGLDMEASVTLSLLFYLITALVSLYGIRYSFKLKSAEEF